jgi:hypothetical protein
MENDASSARSGEPRAADSVVIRPRSRPRDGTDVALLSLSSIGIVLVVYGMPFGLAYFIAGNIDTALRVGAAWAFLLGGTLIFLVWGVRIDREGIRFRRLLGRPRFVEWPRVREIAEISRWEAIIKATFVPWRAWNMSFTTVYYRIAWDNGYYLFPPDDVHTFRESVHRWRPDLMPLIEREPAGRQLPESRETGNPYQSPLSDLVQRPRRPESGDSDLT